MGHSRWGLAGVILVGLAGSPAAGQAPPQGASPDPPRAARLAPPVDSQVPFWAVVAAGDPAPDDTGPSAPGGARPATGLSPALAAPAGIWGVLSFRGYPLADKIAPNGVEFTPIFSLDWHVNLWVWSAQGLYSFTDAAFWGQKAAPGITNAAQGRFDFSKREFDLAAGLAWNYWGRLEGRAFAYSANNLNRGRSLTAPAGYSDGVGLESRYYLTEVYDDLGQPGFDVARASYVSVGYYPSKGMVDNAGQPFKPGPFARGYWVQDVVEGTSYLYADGGLLALQSGRLKLLDLDVGAALRPPGLLAHRWEFRLGGLWTYDVQTRDTERLLYVAVRYVY